MAYQLGIDLGTTYTAAAVCRSSDRRWVEPEVVTLGSRNATVASVLYAAPDGTVLVGEAAERRALTDPDRVVREFKRRIGDPTPIVVAGRAWAPEDLSARLVRWVVDRVAEREGGPADRIAVTHPASWGSHKKDLLARALAAQGLTVTFLAEPQAAALHYATAERVGVGSTIAVYDLGGGTFDAAVVRKGDPGGAGPAGFGLLGRPEGLERLGGVDFDEVVFEHVRSGFPEAFENLDDTDPAVLTAVARMRRDCTEAKEALSSDTEVSIPVLLPGSRGSVRLHRSEFESMIRPQVEETVEALRKAVSSAGLAPEQLSTVLLVGGSSRIPLVAQLVSEQLGRPVAVDADPKNGIAKGAALAVSPQPTTTWPGVAVPAVGAPAAGGAAARGPARGAGAALGGGAAGAAAAYTAPPARPPRPPMSAPGADAGPSTQPGGVGRSPAASGPAPRRPAGPTHESATSLFSGGSSPAPPEQSWDPGPASSSWEPVQERSWDRDVEPRRRPVGLLIGIGGLLALAVVLVVMFAWPDSSPGLGVNTGDSGDDVTTTESTEPAEPTRGEVVPPAPSADVPGNDAPTTVPSPTRPTTTSKEPTKPTTTTTTTAPTTTVPPPTTAAPPPAANPAPAQGEGLPPTLPVPPVVAPQPGAPVGAQQTLVTAGTRLVSV